MNKKDTVYIGTKSAERALHIPDRPARHVRVDLPRDERARVVEAVAHDLDVDALV